MVSDVARGISSGEGVVGFSGFIMSKYFKKMKGSQERYRYQVLDELALT